MLKDTDVMALNVVAREAELAAGSRFLGEAAHGPRVLFLAGDAGIGKTVIWEEILAASERNGFRSLRTRATEPESLLSYVGLIDLLDSVDVSELSVLPPPQRRALAVAVLREHAGPMPTGGGEVAVAFRSLLSALAERRPVLIGIDDVQWLDTPSSRVIEFLLRRLPPAPLGILLSSRTDPDGLSPVETSVPEQGSERLRIGPLSTGALHHVLKAQLGRPLPRAWLTKIHEASGGNPLFAIEIGRALDRAAGEPSLAAPLPVAGSIREVLSQRVDALPTDCRDALLAVAAASHPTLALVSSVAGEHAANAIAIGEEAGLVLIRDGRISFSHPLFRSVLYERAAPSERRRIHRLLGEKVSDEQERARHLALGADGPTEPVASALEEAADRARSRGAPVAAAELLDLAIRLTPPDHGQDMSRRRIAHALNRFDSGEVARARRLLEDALPMISSGGLKARALLLLGTICWYDDAPRPATSRLVEAFREANGDPSLQGSIQSRLASFCDSVHGGMHHVEAAIRLLDPRRDREPLAYTLFEKFHLRVLSGHPPDDAIFRRALALEPTAPWRPSLVPGVWYAAMDRADVARERFLAHLSRAREGGDEASVAELFALLAELELRTGNWEKADHYADGSMEAAEYLGGPRAHRSSWARALIDAHLGRIDDARMHAEEGVGRAEARRDRFLASLNLSVLGFAALSAGDASAAVEAFSRSDTGLSSMGMREPLRFRTEPDHIEALLLLGDNEGAATLLSRLEERGRRIPRPWIAAALGRCRGLISLAAGDLDIAVDRLSEAVRAHESMGMPFELGRSLLALGRVEKRRKQKRSAREALERCVTTFERLGARGWAETVRVELERVGLRRRAGQTELTPTEDRVAALAGSGKTNREVAETLFMSVKTVEAHLGRIYGKLGIRSRAELGARMAMRRPVHEGRAQGAG